VKAVAFSVLLLAKQMVDLKAAMSQREEKPFKQLKSSRHRDQVWSWKRAGGITPFQPFREARQRAEGEWSVRSQCLMLNPLQKQHGRKEWSRE